MLKFNELCNHKKNIQLHKVKSYLIPIDKIYHSNFLIFNKNYETKLPHPTQHNESFESQIA